MNRIAHMFAYQLLCCEQSNICGTCITYVHTYINLYFLICSNDREEMLRLKIINFNRPSAFRILQIYAMPGDDYFVRGVLLLSS